MHNRRWRHGLVNVQKFSTMVGLDCWCRLARHKHWRRPSLPLAVVAATTAAVGAGVSATGTAQVQQ